MPAALSPDVASSRAYLALRRDVEAVLVAGRGKVEEAWVNTYHDTGRLIHEHVLRRQARAEYGAQLFAQLSADTGVSVRTLQECVQFHRLFPIARPVAQLGWNRCRLLCQIADDTQRTRMITELKRGLPTVELKERIRSLNAASRQADAVAEPAEEPARSIRLLKPRRGTPGLYRVIARDDGLAVDVGFKLYLPLEAAASRGLKAGLIVQWTEGAFAPAPAATIAELFTYAATVRRVLDGDTLAVSIALPHYRMDEKLRLRGLDCPEMDTPEGKAAKRFTEAALAAADAVVITTSKVDKYDRYLADVWMLKAGADDLHLNNALLQAGHAVPMGAEEMTDWTP